MHKSDTEDGGHTPEAEVEVNEPLEINLWATADGWIGAVYDDEERRSYHISGSRIVELEDWQ